MNELILTKEDINEIEVEEFKTYEKYVEAGKKLVKEVACYQAMIAYYALKICTIRHGGISNNIYTIKQYAIDIGVPVKTLQNWTLVYRRVIVHLGINPKDITEKDWKVASKVAYMYKQENKEDNKTDETHRKRVDYKPAKRTPKEVKKDFKENYERSTFESEAFAWSSTISAIKNKLAKRELSLANRKCLTTIMEDCDNISDLINDYLSKNKRH